MASKPEKFLRMPVVQGRVPYSRSTIYLLISRGEFPRPHSLGARAVAWLESEIDDWIASRVDRGRVGGASKMRTGVSA